MEGNGNLDYSPKLGFLVEIDDDLKSLSKFSTIFVATIQEAKERISQMEYIFCHQLYSKFQYQSKNIKKLYMQSKREAEDSWKEKEKDFIIQIEKLRLENQQVLEENRRLKLEKENMLSMRKGNDQLRIDELEKEVRKKSKEIDEGMEIQKSLLQLVSSKSSMVLEKGKHLKEREEKINELLAKVNSLEKKVEVLEEEVKEKTEKLARKEELAEGLYKNSEFLMRELENSRQLLTEHEKEKKECDRKVEFLEDNVNELQKKLVKNTGEVEKGRVLQAKICQQIDANKMEILKQKQQLEESENEKELLMEKVNGLEKENNELKENICRSTKVAEGKDLQEKLLEQIKVKDSQLLATKKRKEDLFDAYKRLKSQYNYLCRKSGLTEENMLPQIKLEDESGSLIHQQNLQTSPDFDGKNTDTSAAAVFEMKKVKIENEASDGLEDDKMVKSISVSSFRSPTTNHISPKCPPSVKSAPIIRRKRPASHWIETRSRQYNHGPDPHDDFLDTPLENLRETLNKSMKDKVLDPQIPVQKDLQPDSSDDETQDMNVDPGPEKQQMLLPLVGQKAFKYVEPVRKKAERENLQGVECKQCKKFYDAVLPNDGKDADGNNQNFRCEHHDGVSRHRYKYIPPLTPEGFWNIGFESEM